MLDKDVQALVAQGAPIRTPKELVNLSRGMLADCEIPYDFSPITVRIPSSWCEQKRWGDILNTLPPDLWLAMAVGAPCTMHDRSERQRPSRAMWQGLSWIRYAVNSAWDLPVADEFSRSGMKVNAYWAKQFAELPKPTRNLLRYYLNYYKGDGKSVLLASCHVCEKGTPPKIGD